MKKESKSWLYEGNVQICAAKTSIFVAVRSQFTVKLHRMKKENSFYWDKFHRLTKAKINNFNSDIYRIYGQTPKCIVDFESYIKCFNNNIILNRKISLFEIYFLQSNFGVKTPLVVRKRVKNGVFA